ncbi:gamma-glutamylcyclotransferase family protein [Emcibacter nanhaiensis]|uniref:Gamma-glutamylcyclotransferase n=1 Tax=Emcibacter nanhaiensis TaxID=1505037 RepID=A0A501PC34_9PROT|nr:gamma-glutamylcyclotransferase family protein [Emcibacter nanhaiensis]TPD57930.1 gamma-glutamylcyclotransferase [Emcibacter nanhaiensis]
MKVFFYGLFMDEKLLIAKGIRPSGAKVGYVDGFALRIGARATLLRQPGGRAYGVVMEITPDEATQLYAEDSVADYIPEPVKVILMDGTEVEATCYNLPRDKVTGANRDYAAALLEVATRLGFPESYLDQIGQAKRD